MKDYERQLSQSKEYFETLPWENEVFYANFVAQTYYFVCHSTRLLARSISYFGVDRDGLYRRFVDHIKEENYHERIALSDLKKLNATPEMYPELSITKAFWERQYYLVDQTRGIGLLGYILYLEAIAVKCYDNVYKKIAQVYHEDACKFVKVHITEDPDHVTHAVELINALDEGEKNQIWQNFYQTADLYETMLDSIYKLLTTASHRERPRKAG